MIMRREIRNVARDRNGLGPEFSCRGRDSVRTPPDEHKFGTLRDEGAGGRETDGTFSCRPWRMVVVTPTPCR
jgi:hypothetical protein